MDRNSLTFIVFGCVVGSGVVLRAASDASPDTEAVSGLPAIFRQSL